MDAILFPQDYLNLTPKIFNAIDVVFSFGKVCGVIDAFMVEPAHIQRIARTAGIGVDDAVRLDFTE